MRRGELAAVVSCPKFALSIFVTGGPKTTALKILKKSAVNSTLYRSRTITCFRRLRSRFQSVGAVNPYGADRAAFPKVKGAGSTNALLLIYEAPPDPRTLPPPQSAVIIGPEKAGL